MLSKITRYYRITLCTDPEDDEDIEITLKPERVSKDNIHFEITWETGSSAKGYVGILGSGIWFLDYESNLGTVIMCPICFKNIHSELSDIGVYDEEDCEAVALSIEVICKEFLDVPVIEKEYELPF